MRGSRTILLMTLNGKTKGLYEANKESTGSAWEPCRLGRSLEQSNWGLMNRLKRIKPICLGKKREKIALSVKAHQPSSARTWSPLHSPDVSRRQTSGHTTILTLLRGFLQGGRITLYLWFQNVQTQSHGSIVSGYGEANYHGGDIWQRHGGDMVGHLERETK